VTKTVNHGAAIHPTNPKKIEQIIGDIEQTKNVEPTIIPAY